MAINSQEEDCKMAKFVPIGKEDPMSTLCRMVVNTEYEDLPGEVVRYAKHSILETMAVTVGGSAMEGIPAVVDLVKDKGGKLETVIPFYGGKVPASEAALAIGPMTRALDLAGGHYEGGHCSEYTLPALLAATGLKNKVSGKEFITSFVVGQELLIRIGIAYRFVSECIPRGQQGGHYIFGCIASVGKLIGLSLEELENAQGIGRGMTQPHDSAMYYPPSLMVRVHHGFVCQDAINACLLAKRGITGPRGEASDVLAGPKGYLTFAKWDTDPAAMTEGLGERWEMLNLLMKPYTSCGATHTSVEGILDQMAEHNFDVEDIDSIAIDASTLVWSVPCTPREKRWNPQTMAECQFSLPYVVATAAYDKDFFLEAFTPEARARKDVRELMTRISAKEDTSLPPFAVRVNTRLKDGQVYSKEYFHTKGSYQNPFTEEDLIAKFKKCVPYSAYKLDDVTVDSITQAVLNLEKIDDVATSLLDPLTPK
jgi:2-methylcitrate dehydratase PrpD